ncbi:Normal oxygen consumption protein [Hanseniaspora valbyensis]
MARRSSSRPAPSRQQTRQSSTYAARPAQPAQQQQYAQPQVAQQKQPGMFAQMASTAAGVAVGSAVGHTIGAGLTGMFSGSSNEAQPAQNQQYAMEPTQQMQQQPQQGACDVTARSFTRCLEENNGNMTICDYYLQQLKACQEASKQY